ncbi:MAG: hypothetical protein ACYTFG_12690 [Planctomycetota bacterium]|jgi:hypothetical protein
MGYTTEMLDEVVLDSLEELRAEIAPTEEKQGERRKHPRRSTDFHVRFRVLLRDGRVFNRGRAKVTDVGPGGALLSDFNCARDAFPTQPFTIAFKVITGEFVGVEAECRPVRFAYAPAFGIGVQFESISVRV